MIRTGLNEERELSIMKSMIMRFLRRINIFLILVALLSNHPASAEDNRSSQESPRSLKHIKQELALAQESLRDFENIKNRLAVSQKRYGQLSKKLKNLQPQCDKLISSVDELHSQKAELKKEKQSLAIEKQALEQASSKLNQQYLILKSKYQALVEVNEDLLRLDESNKQRLDNLETELKLVGEEKQNLAKQYHSVKAMEADISVQLDGLRQKFNQFHSQAEYAVLVKQKQVLLNREKETEYKLKQLQAELAQIEKERDGLLRKYETSKTDQSGLSQQLADVKKQLSECQRKESLALEKGREALLAREKKEQKRIGDLETAQALLQEKNKELVAECDRLKQAQLRLSKQLTLAQAKLTQVSEEAYIALKKERDGLLDWKQARSNSLKGLLMDSLEQKQAKDALTRECQMLSDTAAATSKQLNQAQKEIAKFPKQEYAALRKERKTLLKQQKIDQDRLKQLQAELEKMNKERFRFNQDHKILKDAQLNVSGQLADAKKDLTAIGKELRQAEKKITLLTKVNDKLTGQLDRSKEQEIKLTSLQKQLNHLKTNDIYKLDEKVTSLESEKHNLSSQLKRANNVLDSLDAEYQVLKQQNEEASLGLAKAEKELSRTRKKNLKLSKEHFQLESDYDQASQELDDYKRRSSELKKEKQMLLSQATQFDGQLGELKKLLGQTNEVCNKQKIDLEIENERLSEDISLATQEYAELERAFKKMGEEQKRLQHQHEKSFKESSLLHYNLGVFYTKDKNYKKAVREFEKVLEYKSYDAEAHYNLAVIYAEYLNNKEKAIKFFKEYIRLAPNDQDAEQARRYVLTWETFVQQE